MNDTQAVIKRRLNEALAEGWGLLASDPAAAEAKADMLLEIAPGMPDALLLRGRAAAKQGRAGDGLAAFREAAERAPLAPQAWRALADLSFRVGDFAGADAAFAKLVETAIHEPRLREAAALIKANRIPDAERILKAFLKIHPNDVAAMRTLAELAGRIGRHDDAVALLRRALELAPGFVNARVNLTMLHHRQNRPLDAIAELDRLLADDPGNALYRSLKGGALGRIGDYDGAIACFEEAIAIDAGDARIWMRYGHVLKTIGRQADAIAAYRRSLALLPTLGEAWWSLANLKTVDLSDDDIAAMMDALGVPEITDDDRFHLQFAIGKAREDRAQYEAAFTAYDRGNALRRRTIDYRAGDTSALVDRSIALFTPDFFAARADRGAPARDPIFVLGMPRSGSTLIEQILASHPAIEGTQELPEIQAIARATDRGSRGAPGGGYPDGIAALDGDALRALGQEYLERTRVYRRTDRPFFIDKMPNNWMHAGLIHLILPNATIIDARRHPLGCCLSNFKQHFAHGQGFAYSLEDMGRYYTDYVRAMAAFDAALPGRVHRVFYEALIADTEGEVRRLLDRIGLPFDPACLRFHETGRAVRTASSEQVRQPIFREGLDRWQAFDAWLGPLKSALGPVLDDYPDAHA